MFCSAWKESLFYWSSEHLLLCLQKCIVSLQQRSNAPQWWLKLQRKVIFFLWARNKLQEKQTTNTLWEREERTAVRVWGTWWCIHPESLLCSSSACPTSYMAQQSSKGWHEVKWRNLVRKGLRLGQGGWRRRQDLQGKRKRPNDSQDGDGVWRCSPLSHWKQHTVGTAQLSRAQA